MRESEQAEADRTQGQQRADDQALLASADAQMTMLRNEIEAGRESADRLNALSEDVRRAETAEMALKRLRQIQQRAADAAQRLGKKAPQPPNVEPLPEIRQVHRVLPTPESVWREESQRLEQQIKEAGS